MEKEQSTFEQIANKVGALVDSKNKAYGNSFAKTEEFLKILYPDGIRPDQYKDLGLVFRIFDKMMRIASNKGAFEENPYQDIVGYGLLGMKENENQSSPEEMLPEDKWINFSDLDDDHIRSIIVEKIPRDKYLDFWKSRTHFYEREIYVCVNQNKDVDQMIKSALDFLHVRSEYIPALIKHYKDNNLFKIIPLFRWTNDMQYIYVISIDRNEWWNIKI